MLSGKLIRLIETHEDEIAARALRTVRSDPGLSSLVNVPDLKLKEQAKEILQRLGHWLARGNEEELARQYDDIGTARFERSVPLSESVRALCMLKECMMDFIDEQGLDRNVLSLYAEEELERRVGRFFDLLVFHLVRGYEKAWQHAAHAAV